MSMQMAACALKEPVAYIFADYEQENYHLPDDLHFLIDGISDALYDAGVDLGNHEKAAFYAGYLKGSRETDKPVPPLIKGGRAAQSLILTEHNILL